MKKINIFIKILLASTFVIFNMQGQKKKYSGLYKDFEEIGTATYYYYEKGDERIYDGPFYFSNKEKTFFVSCNYKDGKPHGKWENKWVNYVDGLLSLRVLGSVKITGTEIMYYDMGKLEGTYQLSRRLNVHDGTGKKYSLIIFKKTSFKGNRFSGHFLLKNYLEKKGVEYFKVEGNFDANGYCHGSWKIKEREEDDMVYILKREYFHGVLIKEKEIENSTGQVSIRYDAEIDTNKIKRVGHRFFIGDTAYLLVPHIYTTALDNGGRSFSLCRYFGPLISSSVCENGWYGEYQQDEEFYPEAELVIDQAYLREKERREEERKRRIRDSLNRIDLQRFEEFKNKVTNRWHNLNDSAYKYRIFAHHLNNKLLEFVEKYKENIAIVGTIAYRRTVNGDLQLDLSKLNTSAPDEVENYLKKLNFPLLQESYKSEFREESFPVNTFGAFDVNLKAYGGKTSFLAKKKKGQFYFVYQDSLDKEVKKLLEKEFYAKEPQRGVYKALYSLLIQDGKILNSYVYIEYHGKKSDKWFKAGDAILKSAPAIIEAIDK